MLCEKMPGSLQIAKARPYSAIRNTEFLGERRGRRPAFTASIGKSAQGAKHANIRIAKPIIKDGDDRNSGEVTCALLGHG